jgi:4-hydroxybenzoate polyprenyltransferase
MSEAERIKETLSWLKVVFAALVAIDVSVIAWLAQNFRTAATLLVVLAGIAVVCATAGIVAVNHAAFRRLAQLENL